jgi:putative endonuclease
MAKQYYVYILTNKNQTVFYVGITSDLEKRLTQHQNSPKYSFTYQYNCKMLIYVESFNDPLDAIAREKQLKGWRRDKKLSLIRKMNPDLEEVCF